MSRAIYSGRASGRWSAVRILMVCAAFALASCAVRAQDAPEQPPAASPDSQQTGSAAPANPDLQSAAAQPSGAKLAEGMSGLPGPPPTKAQQRQARSAYLAGANKLDHNQPEEAQQDFQRATQLDPGNSTYIAAVEVARQRRITELVRQVSDARRSHDESKAQILIAQARAIDPDDPLVLEHAEPAMSMVAASANPSADVALASTLLASAPNITSAAADAAPSWRIENNPAGPVHLTPSLGTQNFDLRGDSTEIIRSVLQAYGIRAVMDNSVEHKNLRFHMEDVTYAQALRGLTTMAGVFLVPVDPATALIAKDDDDTRKKLERQLEETIYLEGVDAAQFNEIVQLLRGIFDQTVLNPQPRLNAIVVRAPEDVLAAVNQTVKDLQDTAGDVVIEVKLYEVDTSRMLKAGANIPTQFGAFNVDQAAAQLVSQNQSLVQQAIAQGLISSTATNLQIAAALIGSGLVQSSLLNSTIGIFGGGLTQTGITETGSLGINLGLNSSDFRTLDDAQLRVKDRETANFREGTRYPVTTSTYTAGVSGSLGNLRNATVNGVSLAGLASQLKTTTIPQVTYEDLGVTLEAIPVIERSGRVNLKLDLKIEALTGDSVNNIPVLASRDFKSDLTVGDGESALLSSLVSSSEISAMSGLPGISELPGFQLPVSKNTQQQNMQLVVVVTPHVIRRRSNLVAGPLTMMPAASGSQ